MSLVTIIRSRVPADGLAAESSWGLGVEVTMLVGSVLSFTALGRTLGPAGYGTYAVLYAIIGPLVTLASSGVTLALLQHVIRDQEPIGETARSCLSLALVFGAALTAIGLAAALLLVASLGVLAIAAILVTEFVTMAAIQVAAATAQASTGFADAAKIRMLIFGLRIVVLSALFASDTLSVASLGVSMLAVSAAFSVLALRAVGRRVGVRFTPGAIRWPHLRTNLIYSAAITADGVGNEGDKLVLAANNLIVDTGLYAAAYRIIQLGHIPVAGVIQATHTRFLQDDEGRLGEHLTRAVRFGTFGLGYGVIVWFGAYTLAPVLPTILGAEFDGSVSMMRWLAPIVLLRAVGACAINALMGLGRTGLRTILIVTNAVLAMALYLALIPRYGWEGAAIGTLLGEALSVLANWTALIVCQHRRDRDLVLASEEVVPG